MAKDRRPNRPVNYIVGGILDGVMLWVVHQVPRWRIPFVTADYPRILPAITVALTAQIVFYAVLLVAHPLWLHYLAQAAYAVLSAVALGVMLRVYPFAFAPLGGGWLDPAVRVLLIIALVGTLASVAVNLVQALRALRAARAARDRGLPHS